MDRNRARWVGHAIAYSAVSLVAVCVSTVAVGAAPANSPTAQNTTLIAVRTVFPDPIVGGPTTCDVTLMVGATVLGAASPNCPGDASLSDSVAYTVPYAGTAPTVVTSRIPTKWTPFSDEQGPSGQGWLPRKSSCARPDQVAEFSTSYGICDFAIRHVDASVHVPDGFRRTPGGGPPLTRRPPQFVVVITDQAFGPNDPSPCEDTITLEGLPVTFPQCTQSDPPQSVQSVNIGIPDLRGLVPPAGHVDGLALTITSPDEDSVFAYSGCAHGRTGGLGLSDTIPTGTFGDALKCTITHFHSGNGLNGSAATSP